MYPEEGDTLHELAKIAVPPYRRDYEAYQRAIRAVVAAQWAISIAMVERRDEDGRCYLAISEQKLSGTRTAADLVEGNT